MCVCAPVCLVAATRPMRKRLNRQLVLLLELCGVDKRLFLDVVDQQLQELQRKSTDPRRALHCESLTPEEPCTVSHRPRESPAL